MVFYYFIPFVMVAGAPDPFAKLRPILMSGSVLLIAFALYQSWGAKRSSPMVSKQNLSVFWFSAFAVRAMILFSQTIVNFLANTLAG